MIKFVKVRGESMAPTFVDGDYLLITKARPIRSGFVVLVNHPKLGLIVKRVLSVTNTSVCLEGDGHHSTSLHSMKDVALENLKGRVRLAITPKGLKRL